jgi:hypothetical protein
MEEPKPVWLSLISTYGQGRMAESKPYDYPRFLHMDMEEWVSRNLYEYPWFLHMDMEEWASRNLYEYPWFLHMDKE